jgi:hypothetical protein
MQSLTDIVHTPELTEVPLREIRRLRGLAWINMKVS